MIEASHDLPAAVTSYLEALTGRLKTVLGPDLVGVYLQGSASQNDLHAPRSDVDVIAVTRGAIAESLQDDLVSQLDHRSLPVPAAGLELMIVTADAARHPVAEPPYEFWFSTGAQWKLAVEGRGQTSEVLVFLATCRASGDALCGPDAREVFAAVRCPMLLSSLIDVIRWHRSRILDPLHDPLAQYSVLNASRAWMYAQDRVLGSKTQGGTWVLGREPGNELVSNALAIRRGESARAPESGEVELYLERVLDLCRDRLRQAN
ncbi:MAG: aminoglycoside adenylyltransferase domain-containing protein [Erythrobacter sp.]